MKARSAERLLRCENCLKSAPPPLRDASTVTTGVRASRIHRPLALVHSATATDDNHNYRNDIGEISRNGLVRDRTETRYVCYVSVVKNRQASSLTYDVVRLLHHGRLRRIHNGAATTRDCVLATSYPHPRAKDIVPG